MIAVDTNVLVRLLVKDDEAQTRKVVRLFRRLDADRERAYVSDVVICEVVWVLRAAYGFSRSEVSAVLAKVLTARQLGFDSTERLARALHAYETGKGDLADYVIGEHAVAAGCNVVVTFDKTLLRADGFASP
ncbi:MAG: type II toxin-antitoxin system VapC family toxin [Polyangiaceae bacterium]